VRDGGHDGASTPCVTAGMTARLRRAYAVRDAVRKDWGNDGDRPCVHTGGGGGNGRRNDTCSNTAV